MFSGIISNMYIRCILEIWVNIFWVNHLFLRKHNSDVNMLTRALQFNIPLQICHIYLYDKVSDLAFILTDLFYVIILGPANS